MYRKILVALDTTASDRALLHAVAALAGHLHSELLLVHVAEGWAARNFDQLKLVESEEMRADRGYLEKTAAELRQSTGLNVGTKLALGDPPAEILAVAAAESCDLIAVASHGHRLMGDILLGSTIDAVRHGAHVPLFVVPPGKRSHGATAEAGAH